jgi:K+-sensing histidine kinase KdpD
MVLSHIRRYGLAATCCGLALAVAWPLEAPTSCFFLAVMASSLYGGRGPGLFAVALSALAFDYFDSELPSTKSERRRAPISRLGPQRVQRRVA